MKIDAIKDHSLHESDGKREVDLGSIVFLPSMKTIIHKLPVGKMSWKISKLEKF